MEIELEINGRKTRAKEGMTIIQVAAQMGIYIPHFCWHPKLSVAANCRMCLVDIEKAPKPLPACATIALDGMSVKTESDKAKEAQNSVMEFLLINHPLDCPICDQGGECQLQDLAVGYGMSKSRYAEEKRVVLEKNLGPLISTDMTRCIHCTRCVRFGREVGGIMELGMTGRGEHAEIMPFIERTVDSELSGNMIDVCPVGALTSKPFRFAARPWELSRAPSLSPHDSWGSHLTLQVKGHEVKRVVPQEVDDINECWISDRDRFSYVGLSADDRTLRPVKREADARQFSEIGWREAVQLLAKQMKNLNPAKSGFLASPNSTCEELFLWQKIARGLGCGNVDSRLRQRDFGQDAPDRFGFQIGELSHADTVFLVGANPAREQPLFAARIRSSGRRSRVLSIGAQDVRAQFPSELLADGQVLCRPSRIAGRLQQLNRLLGIETEMKSDSLFDQAQPEPQIEKMAERLRRKPRRGGRHVVIGSQAAESEHYSDILQQARSLAEGVNASFGVLPGAANSVGARQVGARPQNGGMNTAEMLRAGLESVLLFNCEPDDFAESAMAEQMLSAAQFVGVITPFLAGVKPFARIVLPSAVFAENEGTLVNGEGKSQQFAAAVLPAGGQEARPGWKILRVLGEELGLDGFNFDSLEALRKMMKEEETGERAEDSSSSDAPLATADSEKRMSSSATDSQAPKSPPPLELICGGAIYNSDMLARRSAPLQLTAQSKATKVAFMHPQDMREYKLTDGGRVRLSDGENACEMQVFADVKLAPGTVLAYPRNLRMMRVFAEPGVESDSQADADPQPASQHSASESRAATAQAAMI